METDNVKRNDKHKIGFCEYLLLMLFYSMFVFAIMFFIIGLALLFVQTDWIVALAIYTSKLLTFIELLLLLLIYETYFVRISIRAVDKDTSKYDTPGRMLVGLLFMVSNSFIALGIYLGIKLIKLFSTI
jgi:hypothetical protein